MSRVFLINVGANTTDSSRARSPIFRNNSFVYVPFSVKKRGANGQFEYPKRTRPFIRNMQGRTTHCDPDWPNLTYGDNCANARAAALWKAEVGNILLFWALLWRNYGKIWQSFSGERAWYLIGALRIGEILEAGDTAKDAKSANTARASKNAHLADGIIGDGQRVFIGSKRYSKLFPRAVDLQTTRGSGLLYRTIRAASGRRLGLRSKIPWNSSTRTCRVIWDLKNPEHFGRARIARNAILRHTGYDLLRDL